MPKHSRSRSPLTGPGGQSQDHSRSTPAKLDASHSRDRSNDKKSKKHKHHKEHKEHKDHKKEKKHKKHHSSRSKDRKDREHREHHHREQHRDERGSRRPGDEYERRFNNPEASYNSGYERPMSSGGSAGFS